MALIEKFGYDGMGKNKSNLPVEKTYKDLQYWEGDPMYALDIDVVKERFGLEHPAVRKSMGGNIIHHEYTPKSIWFFTRNKFFQFLYEVDYITKEEAFMEML